MGKQIDNDELVRLYAEPGHGHKDQELADRFGVGREAIFKRRKKLQEEYGADFFVETERGRYRIDSRTFISNVKVSWEEALILYLATRRLSRNTRLPSGPVQNALGKLATALYKPMTERLVTAAATVPEHPEEKRRAEILATLVRGWSEQYKVHIRYHPLRSDKVTKHTICPYLIEPSPWSDSIYVIAKTNVWDGIVPFQLERIEKATFSTEPFTIDAKFEEETLFQYAWGIWASDKTPKPVQLKFTEPEAIRRLQESIWHPEQKISKPDKHGHVTWQANIAEPKEMLPWIRGWGSDVEVLEPEKLRKSLHREVKRMAQQYGLTTPTKELPEARLLRCWGKTGNSDEDFHPALYHMLDVGHIAEQLLHPTAPSRWRRVLARAFNTDPQTLIHWLPCFIAMHDMGKVSVPFQALNDDQKIRLEKERFAFGRWRPKDKQHHTITGQVFLKSECNVFSKLPRPLRTAWLEMVGGHHGEFSEARMERENISNLKTAIDFLKDVVQEPDEWHMLRMKASQILQNHFLRQPLNTLPEPTNVSAAIMALTGFTILCDWLGSDEKYFSPHADTNLLDYIAISRQNARKAVETTGLMQLSRSDAPERFEALFPTRIPARPLQLAIDTIPVDILHQPILAIIEAPTGEGKTEAALALAHRLAQHTGDDEFYCALPTTATSNQMYLRIQQYLVENLGLATGVNLVHGQAFLVKDDLEFKPMGDIESGDALAWFSPKKKALLAPFAVGTVDQAELAALNVKHNALRLIGLAGKVVILDEVHAYDTYMTTIIEQMLCWLSALGSSVILLSATLPLTKRNALLKAYGVGFDDTTAQSDAYPSLWVGGEVGVYHTEPRAYQPQKIFNLQMLHIPHTDPRQKAEWLLAKIAAGGNVCWICNTVARAQKLAQAVQELDKDVECYLLHSLFPLDDRSQLEKKIRDKYGPDKERPHRSIVIGTQVLEQSLDLDFDLMVSDLAPIDLLLQRMGRLHRHENQRPSQHKEPNLWVNCELNLDDPSLLKMGADRFYTEYILQKTWQAITGRTVITLPTDYRPLVEAVYALQPPAPNDVLFEAWQKLQKKENNALGEAKQRLLLDPNPRRPFCHSNQPTFVEDEDRAAWIVAQTRLGAESVTVIPLERDGDEARIIPTDQRVALTTSPSRETALDLLRRSLRISRREVVQYFKQSDPPQEILFKKSPLLKNTYPLWLTDNQSSFTIKAVKVTLTLHHKWGLIIEKEKIE